MDTVDTLVVGVRPCPRQGDRPRLGDVGAQLPGRVRAVEEVVKFGRGRLGSHVVAQIVLVGRHLRVGGVAVDTQNRANKRLHYFKCVGAHVGQPNHFFCTNRGRGFIKSRNLTVQRQNTVVLQRLDIIENRVRALDAVNRPYFRFGVFFATKRTPQGTRNQAGDGGDRHGHNQALKRRAGKERTSFFQCATVVLVVIVDVVKRHLGFSSLVRFGTFAVVFAFGLVVLGTVTLFGVRGGTGLAAILAALFLFVVFRFNEVIQVDVLGGTVAVLTGHDFFLLVCTWSVCA